MSLKIGNQWGIANCLGNPGKVSYSIKEQNAEIEKLLHDILDELPEEKERELRTSAELLSLTEITDKILG